MFRKAEQELGVKLLINFKTGFMLVYGNRSPIRAETSTLKLQQTGVTGCMNEIAQNIVDAGIKLITYEVKGTSDGLTVVRIQPDALALE